MKALYGPLLVSVALVANPAFGEKQEKKPNLTYKVDATYRWLTVGQTDIPLDEEGTRLGQKLWNEQRLRIMGEIKLADPKLRFELGFDMFTGLIAGDTTSVGAGRLVFPRNHLDSFKRFEPRRAMMEWLTPVGVVRVGHQTNNWGLGILSNSGERELDFGYQRLGDLVERIAFATKPFSKGKSEIGKNIITAVAFDVVYRDTNSDLVDGDVGMNAIGTVFYRTPSTFLGFFGTYRHQRDRDGDRVNVAALDVSGKWERDIGDSGLRWGVAFEAVALLGTTSRLRPDASVEGVDVLAGGGVVKGSLLHKPSKLGFTLEVGMASGDNDRGDNTTRALNFHPDYRVGMVLFPEVLAGMTARSSDRLGDPSRVGQPPSGSENLPTNGSVTNALYFWPKISYRPIPNLIIRLGYLYARAMADVIDPFTSFRAGGVNRNFFDADADRRSLGHEIQLGVRYAAMLFPGFFLHLGLEWGHFFPGEAFTDTAGNRMVDVDRVAGRVMLQWRF